MKKNIFNFLAILFAGMFVFVSCKADVDLNDVSTEMELNMGLALPLGSVHATLGDFIGDSTFDYVSINDRGIYELSYTDTFDVDFHDVDFTARTSESVQHFRVLKQVGAATVPLKAGTEYTLDFPMKIVLAGVNENITGYQRIDSVVITRALFTSNFSLSGTLDLKYGSELKSIQLLLPSKNFHNIDTIINVALDKRFGIDHPIELPAFTLNMLKGKTLDEGVDGAVTITCRLTVVPEEDMMITNPEDGMDYTFKVNLIDYDVIYGWFAPKNQHSTDTLFLAQEMGDELFNRFKDTRLPFRDPRINLINRSNVGMLLQWEAYNVHSFSPDGEVATLEFPNGKLTFPITEHSSSPAEIHETHRTISTYDGTIDKIFMFLPEKVCLTRELKFLSTADKNAQYFLPRNIVFDFIGTIVLPLDFHENVNITYSDTIRDINISDSILVENDIAVDLAELKLIVRNGLPFKIQADFTFLDENNQEIDLGALQGDAVQEGTTIVLAAAPTNQSGFVSESDITRNVLSIALTEENIEKLKQLKSVAYTAALGDNAGPASLVPENSLAITLGIAAQAGMKLDLQSNN